MSKSNMLNIGIICFGIVTSVVILNATYSVDSNYTQAETITTTQQITVGYTLKEYDGRVGIFRGDADKPYTYIDDIEISYLNEYDRELLKNGIEVATETELKSLIEDLIS
ncbi:MAG: BofC C-terminal domain-containing protein [Ruminococcus sp.]|nr:BofC C-terminal domain-containing protein [Ruminococcus sp.]